MLHPRLFGNLSKHMESLLLMVLAELPLYSTLRLTAIVFGKLLHEYTCNTSDSRRKWPVSWLLLSDFCPHGAGPRAVEHETCKESMYFGC